MVSVLVAACGEEPAASDFDPTVAEEFVRNKARADLDANPTLVVKDPRSPDVSCRERIPEGAPPPEEDDDATFICDVEIVSRTGEPVGRQTWRTEIELDTATGDTVVRGSRRLSSTIATAD